MPQRHHNRLSRLWSDTIRSSTRNLRKAQSFRNGVRFRHLYGGLCTPRMPGISVNAWFGAGRTPSSADSNGLNIRCYYDATRAHWQSGLLSSVDQKGSGFSQALGYWEAKVWCPRLGPADTANTPGLWPGFWLDGVNGISGAPSSGGDVAEIEANHRSK